MNRLICITIALLLTGCSAFEPPKPTPWEVSDTQIIIMGCERANQEAKENNQEPVC